MKMKRSVLPLLAALLVSTPLLAQESGIVQNSPNDQPSDMIAWPPQERTFDAPDNWPIPHPGPALNIHALPAAVVFRSLSDKERKAVQGRMAEVGYYAGPIDGSWGPLTWEGTKQYAIRMGIAERLETTAGSLRIFQHIAN